MTILLVYATNSSGTYNASQMLAEVLTAAGHVVTIHRANHVEPQDLTAYDLVILASCTWEKFVDGKKLEGQLQEHMEQLAVKCQGFRCDHQRFAVFGLGDSSYQYFCGAVDYLEKLVKNVGGDLIVPSLRIDGYFFDRENNDKAVTAWAKDIQQVLQKK